jgi:FMN phosphatase YigB (HAD superfamily)
MSFNYYKEEDHLWLKTQNFCDTQAQQLWGLLGAPHAGEGAPSACIFDLDSTLFCTASRNSRVFWRFLRERDEVPLLWFKLWNYLSPQTQRYSIPKTFFEGMSYLGLSEAEIERELPLLWQEYKDFWAEEFFLSRNIAHDEAYPRASETLWALYNKGFEIVYLTGRDSQRGREGTFEALKRGGFPLGTGVHLRLKPNADHGDLEFKRKAIRRLNAEFRVHLSIDNEPENLVMFAQELPASEIVFFHSIMSARLPRQNYDEALAGRKAWRIDSF